MIRKTIIFVVIILSYFSCTESKKFSGYYFNVKDATIYSPNSRVSDIINIDFGFSTNKKKYTYVHIKPLVNKGDTLNLRELLFSKKYSYDSLYKSNSYFSLLIGIFDSEGYGSFYGGWCNDSIEDGIVKIRFEEIWY